MREQLGSKPVAFFSTGTCAPIKFSLDMCQELRSVFWEIERKQLQDKLEKTRMEICNLPYALFLLRCIARLERKIQKMKGEPLFDKPAAKQIRNQRRGSK